MAGAVRAGQTSNGRVSAPLSSARSHRTRLFAGAAWRWTLRGTFSAPLYPIPNRQTVRIAFALTSSNKSPIAISNRQNSRQRFTGTSIVSLAETERLFDN